VKRHLWFAAVVAMVFVGGSNPGQALTLKWGLESAYHVEKSSGIDGWPAAEKIFSKRKLRYFEQKAPNDRLVECFHRHEEAWRAFRKEQGLAQTQEQFVRYKEQNDPACRQFGKEVAPQLYFDFTADTNGTYVLERLEITTLAFDEYKGGGFLGGEAWYDILLSHKPGTKSYDVGKRLTFQGTGRAVLRFWSDNFYPSSGWSAPMGGYIIDIKFVFTVNGRSVAVSTGPFVIDV
jgi:hypothetical protein